MDLHDTVNPFSVSGLTTAEVEERIAAGSVNVNTDLKTKSIRELIVENVCTLFNLINLVLALLVIVTGAWKNLTFLGVVVLNTGIGIVQAVRSKRMVDKLTLLTSKRAVAIRNGGLVKLDLDQIVLDDVIRLGRGDQIPADAVVVEGECHVNESLLTGESDAIFKGPGSELMSGSFIDSGVIVARVIRVGADNYVARINNEAKYVKKVNSEIMNALNAIVRFASVLMMPIGLGLFYASAQSSYVLTVGAKPESVLALGAWLMSSEGLSSLSSATLSTVGALLGMIPQGLVLLTSSVLAIATIRLARRKVLAQQLYCIETLARVDVLCLDKTGTITSGHMEVAGAYVAEPDGALRSARDVDAQSSDAAAPQSREGGSRAFEERSRELHAALAGIARATSADANETCKALLLRYADVSGVPAAQRVVPFNSAKKWSGATLAASPLTGGEARSYVMGAAQFVLESEDVLRYEAALQDLATSCRVLVVARVDGFTDEGDIVGAVRPLGCVTIRDEIRPSAAETIKYFCEQGVTLNVISGDDPRTVSTIARSVGISGASAFVDATTLDSPSKLDAAVDQYHVFGRVTPQQKRELVCALQRRGHTVAMTGDGVNDVLALKEADCSVAMAAGSDAARNVAEIVLVENDFSAMPQVVAEGRRSINNLQRSAALFLTKTLFSMGLAAICIVAPPYPFQPITMTLINFFCIGFPSFVLALEPNRARVKGSFLSNVLKKAMPAAVAVLLCSVLCIAFSRLFGWGPTMLSTMCVFTTCTVGLCLIWRISVPFTPLRRAVFVFVLVGFLANVLLLPDFYSIGRLTTGAAILTLVFNVVGALVFMWLADCMERAPERATQLATGFGRGVRVSVRGRGSSKRSRVSSTGSSVRRVVVGVRARMDKRAAARALEQAAEHAEEGALRSGEAESRHGKARRRSVGVAGKSSSVRKKRYRVEQAQGGIRVRMPKSTRKKDL